MSNRIPQGQRVVVASGNTGKIEEIVQALGSLGWKIEPLPAGVKLPPENGATYEENAWLKACVTAATLGCPALADDSGLEVEALDGEPGVYSARWGNAKNDTERNTALLDRMRDKRDRRARFRTSMILAYPNGKVEVYEGRVDGMLLEGPRGQGGFGYDPLFVPNGQNRTFAEMSRAEKELISHRGQALWMLLSAHKPR